MASPLAFFEALEARGGPRRRYVGELYELERYRGRPEEARKHALQVASLLDSPAWRATADRVLTEPLLRVVASVKRENQPAISANCSNGRIRTVMVSSHWRRSRKSCPNA